MAVDLAAMAVVEHSGAASVDLNHSDRSPSFARVPWPSLPTAASRSTQPPTASASCSAARSTTHPWPPLPTPASRSFAVANGFGQLLKDTVVMPLAHTPPSPTLST